MSHSISLDTAVDMTTDYRDFHETILADEYKGKDILPLSETFGIDAILTLIGDPEVRKLRIYYGMDGDKKVHAILVGVDSRDEDILPKTNPSDPSTLIVEDAIRCPDQCPPASVLNS